MQIFKVFRAAMGPDAAGRPHPRGAVDLADGYIHFSTAQQLSVTLSKHFANEDGLILLSCDPDAWRPICGGSRRAAGRCSRICTGH